TFRNVHNWLSNGQAAGMFEGFHEVLRPGGVLGVVEHRASPASKDGSGYVAQDRVVQLATAAGFVLEEARDVNAIPRGNAVAPNGGWTVPPSIDDDEAEAAGSAAIGESDRMTPPFPNPRE